MLYIVHYSVHHTRKPYHLKRLQIKILDIHDVAHIFSLSKFHTKYKEHDREFQQKKNLILVANTM